jgi:hypothetical protein
MARFIKNLVYSLDDTASATNDQDAATGVFKPLQSTFPYINELKLPDGYNQAIGYLVVKRYRFVIILVYNDQGNHTVYRLNGRDGTYNIIDKGPRWNVQLNPENFIHQGAAGIDVVNVLDPETGLQKVRTFFFLTDNFNDPRYICVEDSIDTNGFDDTLFPYFQGNYDRNLVINMGVPTPNDCISIKEIPRTDLDKGLNNTLLFNTWQFRLKATDVWGRPSEHSIMSNTYVPGVNDCIGNNSSIPRCLALTFDAMNPFINQIDVEYRNCSDNQWYLSDTLFLYKGSPMGSWWARPRNTTTQFTYNASDNTITYLFCRDRECQPVPTTETDRIFNPIPRLSVSATKISGDIALSNNKDGFNPFQPDLINKFNLVVEPPAKVQTNTATITIYIPIFNNGLTTDPVGQWQAVQKDSTGFIWGDNNPKHNGARGYSQFFANAQQSGFGGYLVGTGNYVISTQWYLDSNGVLQEDTEHEGVAKSVGQPIFQKFVFSNIPSGNYIFRLFSHLADPASDQNYLNTSTTVWGLCKYGKSGTQFQINTTNRQPIQELLIDVCDGDYNTLDDNRMLVIADLAFYSGDGFNHQPSKATCGYWHETEKNGFPQFPIELIRVFNPVGATSLITDHNGFYWFVTKADNRTFSFYFQSSCKEVEFDISEAGQGMRFASFIVDEITFQGVSQLRYPDFSTILCNRVEIKGKVFLTGTNIPVSNVAVILTRGGYAVTDTNGEYTIIAHDDNTTQPRKDTLVLASGTCAYTNADGSCIPTKAIQFSKCSTCIERIVNASDFILNFISGRGLLSGGTYGIAVIGWDWLGRPTFAQPLPYIKIPSIIDSQAISPSKVRVDIDPTAIFPEEIKYITFGITPETTIEAYIDWIVDSVQFVDNTGAVNEVAPTQIKIYYASLIEYAKQNNYNTTAIWNFLETPVGTSAASPVQHDVVYFYLNGDGKYFPKNISALVKYDQAGQFFLIDYTQDLAGLLPNALIRLVRPRVCTGTEGYFEVCDIVKIINGTIDPAMKSFYLDAFDTYYLYRQIPVPVFVNPTNSTTIATTSKIVNNPDGSQTTTQIQTNETVTQINEPRTFGFPFESDSPSNLWGKGCHNQGRPFVKNPYEAVVFHKQQIALGGGVSENGVLNFSNYFDEANKRSFNDTAIHGIVSVMPEDSVILVIGEDNNFTVGYSDNVVRVNDDGVAIAPSITNKFGNPQSQIGGNYGCRMFDKNTIVKFKGLVHYLDYNEGAIIQHDYSNANPFTETGADSFIRLKIKELQTYNNKNVLKRYFTAVANPISNDYILTDKIIKNTSFTNSLRKFDVTQQETVSFGVFSKKFKTSFEFTPECYANMEGDIYNKQLFSFVNGIPHGHYRVDNTSDFGKVYGKSINRVITLVAALDNLKKKNYLSVQVYCNQGTYFVSNIKTETGQQSRILLSQFIEAAFGFYAAFLCDINTLPDPNRPDATGPNALMDGDILTGTYAEITFVGDPKSDNEYSQLEGIVVNVIPSEKSGV